MSSQSDTSRLPVVFSVDFTGGCLWTIPLGGRR